MRDVNIEKVLEGICHVVELNRLYASIFAPIKNRKEIVIYGMGKVGRQLFGDVCNMLPIEAVCDNGNCVEKNVSGVPLFEHDACVAKFPNATYIITPQKGFLKIAVDLRKSGISKENIFFFDNRKKCLEGMLYSSIKNDPLFAFLKGNDSVVLYGLGKVGKLLFERLSAFNDFAFLAACDNSGEVEKYKGVPVYMHEECINLHKDAFFLVTPQKGYLEIILRLLDDGVLPERIMFFNNVKQALEFA